MKDFSQKIVEWFLKNARDLPWRRTSDPYKIWISEVMLQQTTVATVIPYFERFLKRFPDVRTLASAREEEVLKFWEGLGYYRRAKNLHKGAQFVVSECEGRLPDSRDELMRVPGIGMYSSGAILSIAFRKAAAALDGNLIRVYSRYFGIEDPVDTRQILKSLWQIAERHVPEDPLVRREFAEGMMELGALICTPKNPRCGECPVSKNCVALKTGVQDQLPRKAKTEKRTKHFEEIYILQKGKKIAFLKKGADPKYPDFCRLPFVTVNRRLKKGFLFKSRYAVTTRDFEVYVSKRDDKARGYIWADIKSINKLLLPAIDRKIVKYFQAKYKSS